jgi:hypothetical protein
MQKSVLLIGIIFVAMFLVSGCVNSTDLTHVVKSMPQLQEFFKENPNANVQVVQLNEDYVTQNIATIRAQCGDQMEISPYYRVTITQDNNTAITYLNVTTQELICLYKPSANGTGTTPPPSPPPSLTITCTKCDGTSYLYQGTTCPDLNCPVPHALEPANYGFEDYPAPFITNGVYSGMIVIGSGAPDSDTIGAVDIAATLAQLVNQPPTPPSETNNDCYFMNVDDTVTISGLTVKLIDVRPFGSVLCAVVNVDGTEYAIAVSETLTINGLKIEVKSASNSAIKAERSATLGFNGVACEQTGTTGGFGTLANVPVAMLDTDLTSAQKKGNLIIIGGSDVNKLTAEIAGVKYPASSYCDGVLDCGTGVATMMLFKNPFYTSKTILIINGDTVSKRYATNVLKDYTVYRSGLKGTNVMVFSENGIIKVADNSGQLIENSFSEIVVGMSKDTVVALVGEPTDKQTVTTPKGNVVEYWYYSDSNNNVWQVGFSNGKVSVVRKY